MIHLLYFIIFSRQIATMLSKVESKIKENGRVHFTKGRNRVSGCMICREKRFKEQTQEVELVLNKMMSIIIIILNSIIMVGSYAPANRYRQATRAMQSHEEMGEPAGIWYDFHEGMQNRRRYRLLVA